MLEKGTYTNLIAKQGDFASYVLRHQTESAEEKSEKGKSNGENKKRKLKEKKMLD